MGDAGELLMRQVLEAMKQVHEGEAAGFPELEVRRLHLLADSLYYAVVDFSMSKPAIHRRPPIAML